MRRTLAGLVSAMAAAGSAGAQQGGIDWSSLGRADGQAIPSGTTFTSAGVTTTVSWNPIDAGTQGNLTAPTSLGDAYVSYGSQGLGGLTDGYAEIAFDTGAEDDGDKVYLFLEFSEPVTDLSFTLADIDEDRAPPSGQGPWQDVVRVYADGDLAGNYANARQAPYAQPTRGPVVGEYGSGWFGDAAAPQTSANGNAVFAWGATPVRRVWIVFATNTGQTADAGPQEIGLSDLAFTGPPLPPGADLRLSQTVSDETPGVGDAITYAVTVTNDGPDAASVVVRDLLPSGVTFASSSAGGAYDPQSGLWQVPGPLPPGQSRTLTIDATVRPNGQRTNLAEVWTSSEADADSTPGNAGSDPFEDDSASTTITPGGNGTPGQAPSLSCGAAAGILDWDQNAWPSGALTRSYQGSDGLDLAFAVAPNGAALLASAERSEPSPVRSADFTGGLPTPQQNIYVIVDQQSRASAVTIDADIGTPGVGASELQFTIFDVDYGANQFEDRIAVGGYRSGAFVAPVLTASSDNRIENGQAIGVQSEGNTGGGGNVTVTFTEPIDRFVVTYGNGPRAPSNPGQQAIGIHDIRYCQATGAQLTAAKSVSVYDPLGEGLYMLPGVDARYQITVANTGDGAADPGTVFLSDKLPDDVTFWSGDVDDGGPQTGPVGFSESGAGLKLGPGDIGFASAVAAPTSFAACGYTPNGGYDANVRHVCFRPRGGFQAGDPDPSFTVWFRARID